MFAKIVMRRGLDEDEEIIWLRSIVDKLAIKHQVETFEVEEVFSDNPTTRFVEKRHREAEWAEVKCRRCRDSSQLTN